MNLLLRLLKEVKFAIEAAVPVMDETLLPKAVILAAFLTRSVPLPVMVMLRLLLNPSGSALIMARLVVVTSLAAIATGIEPVELPVILKVTFDLIVSGREKMVCRFVEVTAAASIAMATEETLLASVDPISVLAALALMLANVSVTVIALEPILLLLLINVELAVRLAILSLMLIFTFDLNASGRALITARLPVVTSVADIATAIEFGALPVILKLTLDLIASGNA